MSFMSRATSQSREHRVREEEVRERRRGLATEHFVEHTALATDDLLQNVFGDLRLGAFHEAPAVGDSAVEIGRFRKDDRRSGALGYVNVAVEYAQHLGLPLAESLLGCRVVITHTRAGVVSSAPS